MKTNKNDMKVEQSVSVHSHALEGPCKRQIVTDPKLCNASHMLTTRVKQIGSELTFKFSIWAI